MSAINVNISGDCTCVRRHNGRNNYGPRNAARLLAGICGMHKDDCPAAPLLIPCRLPPSVTFSVALGECAPSCSARGRAALTGRSHEHYPDCPARPVRVSCSIKAGPPGKEWEGSEVMTDTDERPALTHEQRFLAAHACNDRWALVKALVVGRPQPDVLDLAGRWHIADLFTQRDAVFSALADMARAEATAYEAQNVVSLACGRGVSVYHSTATHQRPSTHWLAAYVEHLIEQIGVLP